MKSIILCKECIHWHHIPETKTGHCGIKNIITPEKRIFVSSLGNEYIIPCKASQSKLQGKKGE